MGLWFDTPECRTLPAEWSASNPSATRSGSTTASAKISSLLPPSVDVRVVEEESAEIAVFTKTSARGLRIPCSLMLPSAHTFGRLPHSLYPVEREWRRRTRMQKETENTIRKTEGGTVWRPILSDGKRRRRTQGIYSQRELRELIVYERARADRAGHELTVVLCELNGHASSHRFVTEAVHVLSRSIRHTDHLGWYDRGALGVILPLTSHVGARQLVESLMQMPDNGHRNVVRELDMSIHSCPDE